MIIAEGGQVNAANWISIVNALAWPIVALMALFYVWRSDAIAKLIQISDAVKDLKAKLVELVETERSLADRTNSISEMTAALHKALGDFAEIKANVENIRDRVDEDAEQSVSLTGKREPALGVRHKLDDMEEAWADLLAAISTAFGSFDRRSVAGEVYRFAHGNRKGLRLSYDVADEIARLHSSIKSFRRRQSSSEVWLDDDTYAKFIGGCNEAAREVRRLVAT